MGRRMAEIGLPGQRLSVLDGGDVDAATGRLLTVAELQAALTAAQTVAASRAHPSVGRAVATPLAASAAAVSAAAAVESSDEQAGHPRWWPTRRRRAVHPPAAVDGTPSEPGRTAPAGFTGPAAVLAWEWMTVAAPRLLVCAAGGGVGVTTLVATLAGLMAAARPDRVLAVEVARRDYSPLTRQVCGPVDAVSAGTWLAGDSGHVPALAGLPAGPSGARVVQAGAHWWPRLTEQLAVDTAVVADLGSLEHADTRTLLLDHQGPAIMVARADSAGVTAALAALTELDAAGLTHRPVLVLCDAAGSRPGVLRTAQRLAATAADALVLPKAPALRRSPIPIGGWDRALSTALADLLCALARQDPADPAHLRRLPVADDTTSAICDEDATATDEEMP